MGGLDGSPIPPPLGSTRASLPAPRYLADELGNAERPARLWTDPCGRAVAATIARGDDLVKRGSTRTDGSGQLARAVCTQLWAAHCSARWNAISRTSAATGTSTP